MQRQERQTDDNAAHSQSASGADRTDQSSRRSLEEFVAALHNHTAFRPIDDDKPIPRVAGLDHQDRARFKGMDRDSATAFENDFLGETSHSMVPHCK